MDRGVRAIVSHRLPNAEELAAGCGDWLECCQAYVHGNNCRIRAATPPETPVVARELSSRLIKLAAAVIAGHDFISPYADDNPKTTPRAILDQAEKQRERLRLWAIEIRAIADKLSAAIITRYLGATNELVDEVQRRMDHVVETAVEWHQAGREGEEWFEAAEKLGAAINSLLELRDKPAPAPECFCGIELEAGLCPNGHDPVATTPLSETAVGGKAERRSNHFSNAAIDKGFPAHISRDNKAHYSDGTVLPVAGDDEGEWCDDCRAYTHTPNCPSYTGRDQ